MPEPVVDTAAALERALSAPGWLLLGVLLHLANQVARGRGWYAILCRTCVLRRRDAITAWVAGAAAGGVTFARGGDAVRILLLARRVPGASPSVLTGTLVAESAGELLTGAAMLAVALALGAGPHLPGWVLPAAGALAVVAAAATLTVRGARIRRVRAAAASVAGPAGASRARRAVVDRAAPVAGAEPASPPVGASRVRRAAGVFRRVGRGCVALPAGAYVRQVLPWQLLSRVCRLLALGCFLAAFGLPATPAAVLLVVFAQGGGRLVPFAPASVGAGAAMLAAAFAPVTGSSVPAAQVAAFFLGTSAVLTIVGTAVATGILLRDQALASAGRRLLWLGGLGRRMRTRVAAAPRT